MESSLKAFTDQLTRKISSLESAKNLAFFNASITGEEQYFRHYEALEIEHTSLLGQEDSFEFLKRVSPDGNISDPVLKRQADLLFLMHLPHQLPGDLREEMISLETAIGHKYTVFRPTVNGRQLTDNYIEQILETSTDTDEVRKTWEASKEVGAVVEKDLLKLVKLRNECARRLGYDNYHQLSLIVSEQDPRQLTVLFDELDELTRDAFLREKEAIDSFLSGKFKIAVEDLRPWHYQDRFFQEAPKINTVDLDRFFRDGNLEKITADYFSSIGMDIEGLLKNSDLYEKTGKNQHAYCINIDRKDDIRVLCNIHPDQKWMNTMLHEFGHAAYEKYYNKDLPFFLREPAHTFVTEAVAMFFGRLSGNPLWMKAMGLIDQQQAESLTPELVKRQTMAQLVFSRWVQVMFRFEKALYEDPGQDLNALWWKLAGRYQGLPSPDIADYPHWASKIHLATAPCYYHNYLLGEILSSQFHYTIAETIVDSSPNDQFLSFHGDEAIGRFFLQKVFAPGASLPWDKLISEATGKSLDPGFYARQFVNTGTGQ